MTLGAQLSAQRKQLTKVCPSCNTVFQGVKIAKYCSNKCRQKAKYIRGKTSVDRQIALSKQLGLGSPYDWSNINIDPDIFILRVLEGCNVRDITRITRYFGTTRVGDALIKISEPLTLKIAERQYNNVCEAINGD
jgi:hypothetical protein